MRTIKKTVACLAAVLMMLSVCSAAFTASATASGICGNNATWVIENGTLTISGDGAMYDYPPGSNNTPWQLSEEPYDAIIINYGVTHIGAWAFAFSSVTHIMIPNSVMTIGEDAFASITGLTNVTIPGSVTSWPEAFALCNDLMNVAIEPGVPLIDRMSFGGCENLHYVGIPDSVRTIGQAAFHQCTGLGLITLPSNLETIGPSAFAGSGLLFVEIPDSVTTIGMEAFAGAPLAAVTLPSNLTTIEPEAFASTNLSSVEIPNTVTYIGQRAFAGSSLTSVTLPSQLMDIREEVFRDCTELSNVTIPASVIYIGPNAFSGCTSLQSIHIPATVQSIAEGALYCLMIFSTSTDSAAYYYATAHNIPFALYGAGNACGDDLTWSLENGVLTINGLGAMYDYGTAEHAAAPWAGETFTRINFPSGITHVGDNAFGGCTAVTDIYYDGTSGYLGSDWGWSTVTIGVNNDPLYRAVMYYDGEDDIDSGHIGSNLIWRFIQTRVDKTNLTAYGTLYISGTGAMPDYTFTSVGPGGIYDITAAPWEWIYYAIEDVVIESGVTNIGACAFYGCDALKSVTIPDTVTSIGASAFTGCGVLANVYFGGILPQWNAITVGSGNAPLNNATLHYTVLSTDSGACGTDLTWVYDPNTLTLTISGTGAMTHYEASGSTTTAPWAAYAEAMRRVVINGGVTSVGNNAFRGCTGLTSITVGSDVVSIGSGAFSDCSNLINVTIGESVASIGDGVFEGCAKLKAITVDSNNPNYSNDSDGALYNKDKTVLIRYPQDYNRTEFNIRDGVIIVANDAFRDCKRLTYISTPESTTTIGDRAFSNCTLLDSVYIRSGVSSIGDQVFDGCESLGGIAISGSNACFYTDPWGILYNKNQTELIRCPEGKYSVYANMPTTVTTIRSSAFLNCKKLTSITIPSGVENIGDAAFKGCTGLTAIVIPDSVTSIADSVFEACSGLTNVTIPAGVTSIGAGAFKNCTAITDVYYSGTKQQWNALNIGADNDPLTNAAIHCSDGTILPANACGDNLTWSIENGVLTVSGTGAMYDYARYGADAPWRQSNAVYTGIVIGSNVTHIGENAFYYSPATSVSLPNTLTSIGNNAFAQSSLTSVTIPGSVTNWPRAFRMCNSLTSATILSGVTTLDECCFAGCLNLTDVTIPASVTSIGNMAFQVCESLTGVILPANLVSIGSNAFDGSGLTGITLPSNLVSIGEAAFYHSALTEITIPDSVTTIGGGAFASTPLEEFTFPAHVTAVPSFILEYCDSLSSVTIPDGVTEIGEYAFRDCTSLQTVYMPASVEAIAANAFAVCTALTDVYFNGTQELWDEISIGSHNTSLTNATIHFVEPEDTYSLSVGDQVSVNLILDLDTRGLTVSDVSVTLDGQPVETTVTNDGDQYRFTIITAPAQIADEIVVTVGDETITTTVMDYCVALCGHEYDEYVDEQNLAKAILQYGKAANEVFDWTDEEITTFGELDHQPVQNYTGAIFTDGTHQITGASFMALAKPEFRFYMSGVTEAEAAAYNQANNITAAYRDTNITEELHARFKKATRNGESVVLVEVTGVSAENMNEEVIVNVPGLGSFTFNGNAFAKAMASDSDPVTQNLGAALYNYGVAANTCFKPKTGEEQP